MRIVKIFIASSEELKPERRVLADMQAMLNNRLFKQGVILQLEFWEHLDSSMNIKEKQEEYNDVLRECDGCIALFWTKFGEFTKKEVEVAYRGMSGGGNPKQLCVLFKETTDQTPDLKVFKDSFEANYGDISSTFSTNEELRLALIEQIETILADSLEAPLHVISEDDKVIISGAVMDKIKVLNVYIAMADDVEVEQNEFMDLVSHINKIFIRRNMCLNIIKHKQNMGNLCECELCMALYYTKFGNYTKEDLESAYNELKKGNNPRKLYVLFKNSECITPELQAFKNGFVENFGHFFCKFENVDTMRLEFLLQLEAYQNTLSDRFLTIDDGNIVIDGEKVVDLNNVPFVALNSDFTFIRDNLNKLNLDIKVLVESLEKDPNNEEILSKLSCKRIKQNELTKEYHKLHNIFLDTALEITKIKGSDLDDLELCAIAHFETGNLEAAHTLLSKIKPKVDIERVEYRIEKKILLEKKNNLIRRIQHFILDAKIVLGVLKYSIEVRIEKANIAYCEAIEIAKEIEYNKEKYAELISDYARFSCEYAKYDKAKELFLEHITLCNDIYGQDSNVVGSSNNGIGAAYFEQGNYTNSLEYFKKALKINEKILGTKHPNTTKCYNNIGAVYIKLGAYLDAEKYFLKDLNACQTTFGEDHISTGVCYNNIGNVYIHQGYFPKALKCFFKGLIIRKKLYGLKHYDIAQSYNNIGAVYLHQGNYALSKKYLFNALKINKSILGNKHPQVAESYNNLGCLYKNQDNYNLALEYYDRALYIYKAISNNPEIAKIYYNMSATHESYGDYSNALRFCFKALDILKNKLGDQHLEVAQCYNSIGTIYINQRNNYEAAFGYTSKALAIYEQVDKDCLGITYCYVNLGILFVYQGNKIMALEQYNKALGIRTNILGHEHHLIIEIYDHIGGIHLIQGLYSESLDLLDKSLKIYKKVYGEENSYIATCYKHIGDVYNKQGNYPEALKYFLKTLDIRKKIFYKDHYDIVSCYSDIGLVYENMGNYNSAIESYLNVLAYQEKIYGNDHPNVITIRDDIEYLNSLIKDKTLVQLEELNNKKSHNKISWYTYLARWFYSIFRN